MKWSDEYATGIERIDEQHKMIFKMAEDFRAALDEGQGERTYGLLLDFLDRYCRGHFGFEERCMEEYRCPVAQRNKEAHASFVEVLGGFRQRCAASGYLTADARELVDTVDRWVADHICRIDVHLKDCVRE
ncbi:MAG: hemerythrin family protein [Nitrospirae bacterium]|nr:hemerythrin family protein [Nitrospirota bacterium]